MMSDFIAGIDYSMTCPAICVYDRSKPFSYEACKFFAYCDVKKLNQVYGRNVIITKHLPYETEYERYNLISDWAMMILNKFKVKEVCLEGFSMGSSGRVFNIAENTAVLKYKMWCADIKFQTPAPTSVKKLFSGKGNATKELMHNSFHAKTNISFISLLNIDPDKSPISDLVDSYAMLDWYLHNIESES